MVRLSLARWRAEGNDLFIKQSYALEDIRVLNYVHLENMAAMVLAAAFFPAVVLGTKAKLEILALHVLNVTGLIFSIPDFRNNALADGIKEVPD